MTVDRTGKDLGRSRDAGDTLIEILVAIAIVGLGVVALLGSLSTSAAASGTHRNISTIDAVLRNFAESARYEIQTRPADGNTGPLFQPCASIYTLASEPYPNSAPAGTAIAVLATGFGAGQPLTVSVGGIALPASSIVSGGTTGTGVYPGTTVSAAGNSTVVFLAPSRSGAISISDGTSAATSTVPFTLASSGTVNSANALSGYQFSSTVSPYGGSCDSYQQIAFTALDPVSENSASGQVSFIVGDFAPDPVTVAVSSNSQSVPATLSFTATVSKSTGAPVTTGSVTWTITSTGGLSHPCAGPNPTPVSSGTVTCATPAGWGQQGTYSVRAAYSNPTGAYPDGQVGQTSIVEQSADDSVAVTADGSTGPLVFTARVTAAQSGGPIPSGTTTWTVSADTGPSPSCDSTSGPTTVHPTDGSMSYVAYTCAINSPTPLVTYTATANYGGDSIYSANLGQLVVAEPQLTFSSPSISSRGSHTNLTFVVTVTGPSGNPAPTGSTTWTLSPGGSCQEPQPESLSATDTATCTIQDPSTALPGYTASVVYAGDSQYVSTVKSSTPPFPG